MKQTIILMACLTTFLSCEVKDNGTDIDLSGYTRFNVDMEAISMSGDLTEQRAWNEGDMIGVFGSDQGDNVGFYLKEDSQGKTVADFYGPVVKGADIIAYFPYSRTVEKEAEGLPCELASQQILDTDQSSLEHFLAYSTRAFASLDDNKEFHFAYPLGMLEVVIGLDETIVMTGASLTGSLPISGRFLVNAGLSVSATDLASEYISLDFNGQEIYSKVGDEYAVLRFVIPPALYSAGDLILKLQEKNGEVMEVQLGHVTVERVDCSSFSVSSITVGVSDIPELDINDGYLE